MQKNYLRALIVLLSPLVFSCVQEPASIVKHSTTSPAKAGFISNNPYKTVVQKGDTLYSLAKRNNVEIRSVIESNRLRPPYILIPGQTIKLPKAIFHIVNESDNLYAISRSYGVDIGRLAQKNNISPPYNITKGQKLLLPSPAQNDSTESVFAKTTKYDYGTMAESATSSAVVSTELSPLNSNKVKSSIFEDDEQSPFASQKEVSKPGNLGGVDAKKNKDEGKVDTAEVAPFTYSSEEEFAPSSKQIASANEKKTNNIKTTTPEQKQKIEIFSEENTVPVMPAKIPDNKKTTSKPVVNPQVVTTAMTDDTPFVKPTNAPDSSAKKEIASGKPNFNWPLSGKLISKFGPKKGGLYNDGINIAAKEGTPIKAAENGDVVYSGNELRGYGNMLLIKHNNGYLTAYAHTDDFLVKKGDVIKKGQVIAHVGQTGHVSSPQLHFSIRQGRKAIDPEKYLPAIL